MWDAKVLARRILGCDPAFLWVTLLNEKGETLAHVQTKGYTVTVKLGEETKSRLGVIDTVFLEAFSQAEKWYGKMDFIVLAFGKAKVMLTHDRRRNLYLATKIPRSGNAEYLHHKIEAELDKDSNR